MDIEHWQPKIDGVLNEESLRKKLENRGYSVTRYRYIPGTVFPDHTHTIDKIDAVLSGQFQMTLHNQSFVLEAGDSLAVPAGTIHSALVMGNESVISLDAIKET